MTYDDTRKSTMNFLHLAFKFIFYALEMDSLVIYSGQITLKYKSGNKLSQIALLHKLHCKLVGVMLFNSLSRNHRLLGPSYKP